MSQRRGGIRRPPTGVGGVGAAGRIFLAGVRQKSILNRPLKIIDLGEYQQKSTRAMLALLNDVDFYRGNLF